MRRAFSFAVFFGIFSAIVGSAHYYVWARLVRGAGLSESTEGLLTLVAGLLFLTQPLGLGLLVRGPTWAKPLARWTFTWMGLLFLLLCATAAGDLVRLGSYALELVVASGTLVTAARAIRHDGVLAASSALVGGALGAIALFGGTRVRIKKLDIELSRLPQALHGTTLVQWTDVHVGSTIRRPFIEAIVDRTNQLEPDVIVITGDLVDGSVAELRQHVEPLARLKSRFGVFFVTGNHEYYSGVEEWCAELTRLGVRVLRNECVSLGDGEHRLDLAGIDDYQGARYGRGHGPNLEKALEGREPTRELVLLAHQPRAIHEAAQHGVGLVLSGHTHGGQIWPWNFLLRLQQPIISGLVRVGRTFIYVSNGTGYWGPPMRLGAPAEITYITLKTRKPDSDASAVAHFPLS